MELKNFIKSALSEISHGVIESQEELRDLGVLINPPTDVNGMTGGRKGSGTPPVRNKVQNVEITASVTVSKSSKRGGGIGLNILAVTANMDIKEGGVNEAANIIKFTVPIAFPLAK